MNQGFRISPQQKHLWLLQGGGAAGPYRSCCVLEVTGELGTDRLAEAVREVAGRYEILRTRLRCPSGLKLPVQTIDAGGPPLWQGSALGTEDETAWPSDPDALLALLEQLPLDAGDGPVLYASVVRRAPDRHLLLLATPALCVDGSGLRALVREIACELAGEPPSAEPLQYPDLAEWMNGILEAEDAHLGEEHWRRVDLTQLAGLWLVLETRPVAARDFEPRVLRLPLALETVARIRALAATEGCPADTFLLAAWQLLLARLSGRTDVIVGCQVSGRSYDGLDQAIGLFARHVPISARVEGESDFLSLWRCARQALKEALPWQEFFTWETVREVLGKPSEPLFFPFVFAVAEPAALATPPRAPGFSVASESSLFDRCRAGLVAGLGGEEPAFELRWDSGVLSEERAIRMGEQLAALLAAAALRPDAPLRELGILSDGERRLIAAFNATAVVYPDPIDRPLQAFVEEQAGRAPQSLALVCAGERLTYAELNARANRLARHLAAAGVGPESLVALYLPRSPDMVVSILAVLKADGAFVPLDPGYPRERLSFMVRAAGPRLILTHKALAGELEGAGPLLELDREAAALSAQSAENPVARAVGANAAYVIYTSGSSGEPRGVVITRENLAHYVQAMREVTGVTAADRYLHTASFAFSSSVRQLFVPLAAGGAVVVATDEQRADPPSLFRLIGGEGVTAIDLVPSFWRHCFHRLAELTPEARREMKVGLRRIVIASEPLLSDLPLRWRREIGWAGELVNMFGQTETCGIVASYPIPVEDELPSGVVPVGRPIANTRIHLLDHGRPVPVGVEGEIHIGGLGLGRGYLNRPELTAERFVPDAEGDVPGARLYRTGDLGRLADTGFVEFLGRLDHQVKIRGFRVELGEIEATLAQFPGLHEAVVLAREDSPGDRRLAAYVVPASGAALDPGALHAYLRDRLPAHMLPSSLTVLEELPRTPSGKMDRGRLPVPAGGRDPASLYVPPRTPIEITLAEIWGRLLAIERPGARDNFFRSGGHSLLATQMVSRLRDAFGVDLSVRSLAEDPTIAGLAEKIERARWVGKRSPASPGLPAEGREEGAL